MLKSLDEIVREIARLRHLKFRIPRSLWNRVDFQLDVLENNLTEKEIYNMSSDDSVDDVAAALEAFEWKEGKTKHPPSEGWGKL